MGHLRKSVETATWGEVGKVNPVALLVGGS